MGVREVYIHRIMVPFFVTMIPVYIIVRDLGWLNSYAGLIVPNVVQAFGIFLMRQYMLSVPDALLDAARMDGAFKLWILLRVGLPLSAPALAALAIFAFVYQWDNFLWPLLVVQSPSLYTVPLGINSLRSYADTQRYAGVLMAGAVLGSMPSVAVFLLLQRYFVQGIALTGIRE